MLYRSKGGKVVRVLKRLCGVFVFEGRGGDYKFLVAKGRVLGMDIDGFSKWQIP